MVLSRAEIKALRKSLNDRKDAESDIIYREYVGPVGYGGLHRVKIPNTDQEEVVASSLSDQTFRPGATVPLGRNSGRPGKFIIGSPPPGRKGASRFSDDVGVPGSIESVVVSGMLPDPSSSDVSAEISAGGTDFYGACNDHTIVLTGHGFEDGEEVIAVQEIEGVWVTDPYMDVVSVEYDFSPTNEPLNYGLVIVEVTPSLLFVDVEVGDVPIGYPFNFLVRGQVWSTLARTTNRTLCDIGGPIS